LAVAVLEDLKTEYVDRNVALAQVGNDSLRAVVERRGHDDDLVTLVQRFLVEVAPKARAKVLGQAATWREAAVDRRDVIRPKLFDPSITVPVRSPVPQRSIVAGPDQSAPGTGPYGSMRP
jgi:hypothetical protein